MSLPLAFVPFVLLYLLAIAYLIWMIRRRHQDSAAPRLQRRFAPAGAYWRPLRLDIEGTERPELRSTRFLAAFGLNARSLRDIRAYEHPGDLASFPSDLSDLVRDLHVRGSLRGAAAMGLLCHGRSLTEGEALYIALVDSEPEPLVVAFVDRRPEPRQSVGFV
jgi:hypothetical protein